MSYSVQGDISQVRTVSFKMLQVCLLRNKMFTLMFNDWLIQQILTEHLLYARRCSRHWGCSKQSLCPCEVEYSCDGMDWHFLGFKSLFRCVLLLFCFEYGVGKQLLKCLYVHGNGWPLCSINPPYKFCSGET